MIEKGYFFFDEKDFSNLYVKSQEIKPDWDTYNQLLENILITSESYKKNDFITNEKLVKKKFESIVGYHRFKWLKLWYMNKICDKTQIDKSSEKVKEKINKWIKLNSKPTRPIWEPYSVSERIINWIWCLNWLILFNKITNSERRLIEYSLRAHLSYLEKNLEYRGKATNNHILKNAQALLYGGCYFYNDKKANNWRKIAKDIFLRELDREFSSNYVHLEQSSHYHCLITMRYLECLLLVQDIDKKFFEKLYNSVKKMVDVAYNLTFPDSKIPLFSDVSPDEPPSLAPRNVLNIGSIIFEEEKYSKKSDGLNLESLWFLGGKTYKYKKAKDSEKETSINVYPKGFASFDGKNICFRVDCGPTGFEPSPGHGHHDELSIQLWNNSHIWVRDSGSYSYDDKKWKKYFKEKKLHSTIVIDKEQNFISKSINSVFPNIKIPKIKNSNAHPIWVKKSDKINAIYFENKITFGLGIKTFPHKRMIISSLEPEYLIVVDYIFGNGKHMVEQLFQIDCEKTTVKSNSFEMKNKQKNFSIICHSNKKIKSMVEKDYYSPYYGKITKKPVINNKLVEKLPVAFCSFLSAGKLELFKTSVSFENEKSLTFLMKILFKTGDEHYLILSPEKNKIKIDGFQGDFQIAFLKKTKDGKYSLVSDGNCIIENKNFIRHHMISELI